MAGYSDDYVPKCMGNAYPQVLSELHEERCEEMCVEDLQGHCNQVFDSMAVTKDQAKRVEMDTQDQANSKTWHRLRTGRITASRMKSVCKTPLEKPARSLINGICYPTTQKFSNNATKWGCDHERDAVKAYCEEMKTKHENFKCTPSGLVINPSFPHIGASPDSFASCDCCGDGVVEVKCPYCVRYEEVSEVDDRLSYLKKEADGSLKLNRSHAYFYQVQTQIFVTMKDYCNFVVWTESSGRPFVERITGDLEFWSAALERATLFFKNVILPELVARVTSRSPMEQQPTPVTPQQVTTEERIEGASAVDDELEGASAVDDELEGASAIDDELICICRVKYDASYDRVIGCDNDRCKFKWLHFKCIGMKRAPKGSYFCKACRQATSQ